MPTEKRHKSVSRRPLPQLSLLLPLPLSPCLRKCLCHINKRCRPEIGYPICFPPGGILPSMTTAESVGTGGKERERERIRRCFHNSARGVCRRPNYWYYSTRILLYLMARGLASTVLLGICYVLCSTKHRAAALAYPIKSACIIMLPSS